MPDGYAFRWRGKYAASLTTGGDSQTGQHDLYFNLVGRDTHEHMFVRIAPTGAEMGTRLKDQGQHVSPHFELGSFTTQPVIRGRATWDPRRSVVETTIADIRSGSAYTANPVATGRVQSSRQPMWVDVPVPDTARSFDFEVAVTLDKDTTSESSSPVLRFGGSSPLGLRFTVTRWST